MYKSKYNSLLGSLGPNPQNQVYLFVFYFPLIIISINFYILEVPRLTTQNDENLPHVYFNTNIVL